jgi:hypothetical protein
MYYSVQKCVAASPRAVHALASAVTRTLHVWHRLMAKIAELETRLYEKEPAGNDLIQAVHCE